MEFFNNAKAVRFKSHLDKYLVADDDQRTVRQSPDGSVKRARWLVEFVQGNPHVIRLRSNHTNAYLTASDESFLMGTAGKKVTQSVVNTNNKKDNCSMIEWEPIKDGYKVKLRTKGGKFLRANGAMPPWRNSITHDLPHRTATQDWVLWDVDVVDIGVLDGEYLMSASTNNNVTNDDQGFFHKVAKGFSGPNSPSVKSTEGDRRRRSIFGGEKRLPSIGYDRSSESESRGGQVVKDDFSGSNSPSSVKSSTEVDRRRKSIFGGEKRLSSIGYDRSSESERRCGQGGMEFFDKAKAVRLQSHLGKYLVADDDEQTVRQSRNGASSHNARWTVESVNGNPNRIRLKSCHGLYLTASSEPFLLGMTGKKVLTEKLTDVTMEWEPVKEGLLVKLMTNEGKFLRANGGSPPWRNSVTHDVPHRTATQSWVLWGVDVVDILITDPDIDTGLDSGSLSRASSFNSLVDDYTGSPDIGSPMVRVSGRSRNVSGSDLSDTGSPVARVSGRSRNMSVSDISDTGSPVAQVSGRSRNMSVSDLSDTGSSMVRASGRSRNLSDSRSPLVPDYYKSEDTTSIKKVSGMEFFRKAKSVRLKSHHEKFLTADTDEESVIQDRFGTSKQVRWEVEFVEGVENVIRLKSCYNKYLTALDDEFLLGVTGRKVLQSVPRRLDSSVEWEPIRDGMQVKLKTRYGNYLRANGGLPPWRNSITHDIPHRHRDWILWTVDIVETRPQSPPKIARSESLDDDLSSTSFNLRSPMAHKLSESFHDSPRKSEGRLIYYHVVDDDGNVDDSTEGPSFMFKGHGLEELTQKLEEETGHEDVIVCSRNRVNGKLYPLRLALPPNNATMHVVVIPSTSTAAKEFMPSSP